MLRPKRNSAPMDITDYRRAATRLARLVAVVELSADSRALGKALSDLRGLTAYYHRWHIATVSGKTADDG